MQYAGEATIKRCYITLWIPATPRSERQHWNTSQGLVQGGEHWQTATDIRASVRARGRPDGIDMSPDSQRRGDEAVQREGCCAITSSLWARWGRGGMTGLEMMSHDTQSLPNRPEDRQAASCPDSISAVQLRIVYRAASPTAPATPTRFTYKSL